MKKYIGSRSGFKIKVTVTDDGINRRELNPRIDLRNHSPDGFNWGYGGSGPAQLALAILADMYGDEIAMNHYQQFKFDVIAKITKNQFELTETEISEVVKI